MAGPARTATPIPRRGGSARPAANLTELMANRLGRGDLERDALLTKVLDGKLNVVGDVALTADGVATTTDIDDPRIGPNTRAFLQPLDTGAQVEYATGPPTQAVNAPGKIRLTHTASVTTRTFAFVLLG